MRETNPTELVALINIVHTVIAYPSGILADKIGKEKVLIIGYTIFPASAAMMALLDGEVFAYIIAAVFGAYIGITETLQMAVIPKYVQQESRGTAFGLYNVVVGVGFFCSSVAFGFLWYLTGIVIASAYSIFLQQFQ